jgi:hypothetical protein
MGSLGARSARRGRQDRHSSGSLPIGLRCTIHPFWCLAVSLWLKVMYIPEYCVNYPW